MLAKFRCFPVKNNNKSQFEKNMFSKHVFLQNILHRLFWEFYICFNIKIINLPCNNIKVVGIVNFQRISTEQRIPTYIFIDP